LTSYKCHLVI
jgi:hypothetical protein